MNLSTFFNSVVGMYLVQSFCHSVVAAMITDRALKAWRIFDPLVRQRFRLIVILFPIISFPCYQLINPARSSALFRLDSLFDMNRWLFLNIWGGTPLSVLLVFLFVLTSVVFLVQEMLPILRHTLDSGLPERDCPRLDAGPFIDEASRTLRIRKPEVFLVDDDNPVLFSTTGKDAVIYLSTSLSEALTTEQREAALAHELAHIARNRRPLLIAVFLLRIIMFFNPIALVKFRRAVRDEEKICDDIAVSLTGNAAALAATLKLFHHKPDEALSADPPKLATLNVSLEEYSHNLHLDDRIRRLESGNTGRMKHWGLPFAMTLLTVAALNYFIV